MNENNYIKVSDEVLNLINYENAYEILLVLNILKLAKPHKMIWGAIVNIAMKGNVEKITPIDIEKIGRASCRERV